MNYCEAHPIFLSIAHDTLERVRYDRQRAPKRIQSILAYIERRLFAPELSASMIYRDCDIRDRSISTFFRNAIGQSPWRYIESCRIEVGEKLVRETPIKISWISALLGYSSLKVFSNAFSRQTGDRPMAYRKRCRASATEIVEADISTELSLVVNLRRAVAGRLDLAEADRLLRRLYALYPDLQHPTTKTMSPLNPAIRRFYC